MQINRLFDIVYILLDKKTVTAKELAEHFSVSVRTIYRDIDTLSSSNIPIYTNKGKHGGISLLDNFVLNKSVLTEKEQNEILFALQSLKELNLVDESSALNKLNAIFNKSTTSWIDIDFSHWGSPLENNKFNIIKEAILNSQILSMDYFNSYGEKTTRDIEPLQIYFKDKAWYVKAYCLLKEDYRLFKINRMKNVHVTQKHFKRELAVIKDDKPPISLVKLTLKLSNKVAYRLFDEFDEKDIVKNEDGSYTATATFPEDDWVYGYILSFGEEVAVISPIHIREIIKEKLTKSLENYNN